MRWLFLIALLFVDVNSSEAQDSLYTRKIISTLTSASLNGRGYVKKGDEKAAKFLRNEFQKIQLKSALPGYYQHFNFPVNTFPSAMNLVINSTCLAPGKDFIVNPSSSGLKGKFALKIVNHSPSFYKNEDLRNTVLIIDTSGNCKSFNADSVKLWNKNPLNAKGLIFIKEQKLTWSVSMYTDSFFSSDVLRKSLPAVCSNIKINIINKFIPSHLAQNIIGIIPGTEEPDSFIFITAHYDHLGRMGKKTYFPGANDNASGISMLLNLAKYFSEEKNHPKYSIVFIAFAAEEAGLLGSKFYTEHPVYELKKINFLINLDLLGTGDEGLMVVNGSVFPDAFSALEKINEEHHYLKTIGKRGAAHNSDHYYFSEKGVPSFFCYTLGGITAYHDIYDKAKTLPLTKYKEVFSLLCDFIKSR